MRFWAFRFELVGRKIAREGVKKWENSRKKNWGLVGTKIGGPCRMV